MEVIREYINSSDKSIRMDTIQMVPAFGDGSRILSEQTYKRQIKTQLLYPDSDRVVDSINIYTDADTSDFDPSGANNYSYVEWTNRSKTVRCNMTDLPIIGESV